MKRTTRARLVLAAAIILLLALTTAAFATGALESIFRGMSRIWRNDTVDVEAIDELANWDVYSAEVSFATAEEPLRADVTQSYYDGEQLILGVCLRAPRTPADLDFGADDPAFQTLNGATDTLATLRQYLSAEELAAFEERYRRTGRAGVSYVRYDLGDVIASADGAELGYKRNADDAAAPGQTTDYYYVSDSPLPQSARHQASLEVVLNVYGARVCHYMDEHGEYASYGHEREERQLRFTVTRSAEAAVSRSETKTFGDYAVEATLTATPVDTQVSVRLDRFDKWDESWAGQAGRIYDYALLADDVPLNGELVGWTDGDVRRGVYAPLPVGTRIVTLRPLYREQSGHAQSAVSEEDIVFDLRKPASPAPSPMSVQPSEVPYELPVAEAALIEQGQRALIDLGLTSAEALTDAAWRVSLGFDVNYEKPTPTVLGEARRAGAEGQAPTVFFAVVRFDPDTLESYGAEAVTVGPNCRNGEITFGDDYSEEAFERWETVIQEKRWATVAETWLRRYPLDADARLTHLKNRSGDMNVFGYQTHFVLARFEDESGGIHDVTVNPDTDQVVAYEHCQNIEAAWY